MDEVAILEFWHERSAILEFDSGISRQTAEMVARHQTSLHFEFDCFALIEAERKRLSMVQSLQAKRLALHSPTPPQVDSLRPARDVEAAPAKSNEVAVLEFWRGQCAVLVSQGLNRTSAEVIARQETSKHFGFCCIAIVQAERQRLEVVRRLASMPGLTVGRQLQTTGR